LGLKFLDDAQVGTWHLDHNVGDKPPDAFGCEADGVPQQRSPSDSAKGMNLREGIREHLL